MVPAHAALEATKRSAGFGETVVHVIGYRGVIRDDTAKECKMLHRVD